MSRNVVRDPKDKVYFRIRQSIQIEIERKSEELGISQGAVADMLLSAFLSIADKVHKKKVELDDIKRAIDEIK